MRPPGVGRSPRRASVNRRPSGKPKDLKRPIGWGYTRATSHNAPRRAEPPAPEWSFPCCMIWIAHRSALTGTWLVSERGRVRAVLHGPVTLCTFGRRKWLIGTRSDSDAARIKHGTLSVKKAKRKHSSFLQSFLSHANGGRTKAKYRKNETIFRQGEIGRCCLLRHGRQVQGHRGFREGQGSHGRSPWEGGFLRRRTA